VTVSSLEEVFVPAQFALELLGFCRNCMYSFAGKFGKSFGEPLVVVALPSDSSSHHWCELFVPAEKIRELNVVSNAERHFSGSSREK